MSCDSKDREFSIVIDINENYESYKESAKSNKDEFKNRFVLFYTTWNDVGFYTLLVVRNFYEDPEGKKLGNIRICHDDLKIDNYDKEAREIRYFLEKDHESKGKIDITDKLGKEYISIADSYLYDKLKEILIDDEAVIEFLSRLNEISTITDNTKIERVENEDWYKNSFIREEENRKIVDFTKYKNDIDIKDNSYYVLKKLPEYFDKIKNNIAKLYDWALKYYLSIEEAKQVFDIIKLNYNEKIKQMIKELSNEERKQASDFIKINYTKEIEQMREFLKKFKDRYVEYSGFIKEIKMLLIIDPEDYIIIIDIRHALKVKKNELENLEIGHYTRLDTIKILIKKKNNANETNENNEDKGAYLRLTNGRQMNDPLEGKILLDYILDNNNLDKDLTLKKWDPTYWYISSATTETDSLPMWKQYGGNAEGGMLIYDSGYLKSIIEKEDIDIYRVCYIDVVENKIKKIISNSLKDDEIKKLEKNINHLKNKIKKLKEKIENLEGTLKEKMEILELYISTLSDIAFLFKKYDYAYENEYRIVVNRAYNEDKIEEQVNPNYIFPFLYTYLKDTELKYSKLILGPKAIDIDYIAPYINYCDKDIEIERSSISYR